MADQISSIYLQMLQKLYQHQTPFFIKGFLEDIHGISMNLMVFDCIWLNLNVFECIK